MIRFEVYGEEVLDNLCNFVSKLNINDCSSDYSSDCDECIKKVKEWLLEEYKMEIDWSKVPIDTPVLVKCNNIEYRRCFASYLGDGINVFDDGRNSWTNKGISNYPKEDVSLVRESDIMKYSKNE